jgi:tripartite-type tricarboxylate transporter receptor subunit TctC
VSPKGNIMKFRRRQFLKLAAGAVALPAASQFVSAQAYPTRLVRIIAGYPAGGVVDIYARLIGQRLSERLGQSFIVENRSGAAGTIGVDAVVRAPPDGYTLLLTSSNDPYNELIYPDVKFNYIRDIAPVANIATTACIMVVNPSLPVRSVPEFIAPKANRGKVNFGSAGIGTAQHVQAELFKLMAGVDMVHVPYRGGAPAVADLLAGQVQVMFEFMATAIPHVRSGGLRALGLSSAVRSQTLPDVPTVGEFLPGFEASFWFGIAAPKATPAGVIITLNREINAAVADRKATAQIAELGGTVLPLSPPEFTKLIVADTEKWSKVIRTAGIKAG